MSCGSCKCYICGTHNCFRALCRGSRAAECKYKVESCGRFIFDAEKLRDVLIPPKKEEDKEATGDGADEHI